MGGVGSTGGGGDRRSLRSAPLAVESSAAPLPVEVAEEEVSDPLACDMSASKLVS
jgi:hypothetical protein